MVRGAWTVRRARHAPGGYEPMRCWTNSAAKSRRKPQATQRVCGVWLTLLLAAGACLFAGGLGQPVYTRVSWLGLLPLLILVRCSGLFSAAAGGAFWGLCVYFLGMLTQKPAACADLLACLRLSGTGAAFGMLGSAATRRFGFHPFLLSAAWLAIELIVRPTDSVDIQAGGFSYFFGRVLGAACLGGVLVFCNGLLVWLVCALAARMSPPSRWARSGGVQTARSGPLFTIPNLHLEFTSYPRAPPGHPLICS